MLGKQIHFLRSAFLPCKYVKEPYSNTYSLQTTDLTPGQDITSINKLITDYSKAGDLISAQRLFDHMPQRDVVSWNSIMSAYAQHENFHKLLQTFSEMHNCGLIPNHTSISTVLSACTKLRALGQGRQIHGHSVKTCSSSNVFVGTSLIMLFSRCGIYDCLIQVFKDINYPNVASSNALISGFVLNLQIEDARQVFDTMPVRNVVSWTAMIHGFIEVKKVGAALELFNLMPVKNSVTWSVMVGGFASNGMYEEAIKFFTKMIGHGVQATAASVINVISAASAMENVKQGRKIHGYAIKIGFQKYESIEASLISMYCKCLEIEEAMLEFRKIENKFIGSCNSLLYGFISNDKVDDARTLFDDMKERDAISWNLMISGYLKCKRTDAALDLFSKMQKPTVETITALMMSFVQDGRLCEAEDLFNVMPEVDVIACTSLISGYLEHGLLHKAMELFRKMPEQNVVTYNVMISGLLKHGNITEAYNIFNECPRHDNASWDALIRGYVQNGLLVEAFLLYKKMLLSSISPGELVVASLLNASSRLSVLTNGQQIHPAVIKLGHESSLVVGNSLVNMYCRFGDILIGKSIFDRMTVRDVVTWNTMICGYAFSGFGENAIRMFEDMRITDIKPDNVTFLGLLSACAHVCLIDKAQYYFSLMKHDYGITPTIQHYACTIDLLCRMGKVEQAERLIFSMPFQPDSKIWTSLLSGCRLNGNTRLAEFAANELLACNARNPMPFLHLINVHGTAGRWDVMEILRKRMDDLRSNKPQGCSWI